LSYQQTLILVDASLEGIAEVMTCDNKKNYEGKCDTEPQQLAAGLERN
jgi:hypothetical protein